MRYTDSKFIREYDVDTIEKVVHIGHYECMNGGYHDQTFLTHTVGKIYHSNISPG